MIFAVNKFWNILNERKWFYWVNALGFCLVQLGSHQVGDIGDYKVT